MKSHELLLMRHGESELTAENRFCGWLDSDLSAKGARQVLDAAKLLRESNHNDFDIVYTSLLKRAVKSVNIILGELDLLWIPVVKTWRLNERMYGALQGLHKKETSLTYGDEKVKLWRRSFDVRPPALSRNDPHWAGHDRRYQNFAPELIPLTESLADATARILPFWCDNICSSILNGKKVLIVTHGSVVRALVKHIDPDVEDIAEVNIPTGFPILYKLSSNDLKSTEPRIYLHGSDAAKKAEDEVAQQHLSKSSSS